MVATYFSHWWLLLVLITSTPMIECGLVLENLKSRNSGRWFHWKGEGYLLAFLLCYFLLLLILMCLKKIQVILPRSKLKRRNRKGTRSLKDSCFNRKRRESAYLNLVSFIKKVYLKNTCYNWIWGILMLFSYLKLYLMSFSYQK